MTCALSPRLAAVLLDTLDTGLVGLLLRQLLQPDEPLPEDEVRKGGLLLARLHTDLPWGFALAASPPLP